MPNIKKQKKKVNHFNCPFCKSKMWRLGDKKYYIYHEGKNQIRQNTKLSAKKAVFVANKFTSYSALNCWLEIFYCNEHGKLWLKIARQNDGNLVYQVATREDWQQTNNTINPDFINPSVSEYSYKMSRRPRYVSKL